MSKIGLYVYQISAFNPDGYQSVRFSLEGVGSVFRAFLPRYIQARGVAVENGQAERTWRLISNRSNGNIWEGLINYGSFGVSSNIVDPDLGEVLLERKATDVEEIPLYYQFWVPADGPYAFLAFQSFRDRSCVSQVKPDLINSFNANRADVNITIKKVMPAADALYANNPVKKIILSKRRVPKDRAEILQPLPLEEIDVELTLSATRRRRFGTLRSVSELMQDANGRGALLLEDFDFDRVSAEVQVGSSYLKIGVIGPSQTAGVIDITDQVEVAGNNHPTFNSLSAVTSAIIGNFAAQFGMDR